MARKKDELNLNGHSAKFLQEFGQLQQMVKDIKEAVVKENEELGKTSELAKKHDIYFQIMFWAMGGSGVLGLAWLVLKSVLNIG